MSDLCKGMEELAKQLVETMADPNFTPSEKAAVEAALLTCNDLSKAVMTLQDAAQESNELRADHTKLLNDMLKRKTDLCNGLTMITLELEKFGAAAINVIYKYGTDIVNPLIMKIATLDAEVERCKAFKSSFDLNFNRVEESLEGLGIKEPCNNEAKI